MWRGVEIPSYYTGNYRDRRTPLFFSFSTHHVFSFLFLPLSLLLPPKFLHHSPICTPPQAHSLVWLYLSARIPLYRVPCHPLIRGALTLRSLYSGFDSVIADPSILHTFVHSHASIYPQPLQRDFLNSRACFCFCFGIRICICIARWTLFDQPIPLRPPLSLRLSSLQPQLSLLLPLSTLPSHTLRTHSILIPLIRLPSPSQQPPTPSPPALPSPPCLRHNPSPRPSATPRTRLGYHSRLRDIIPNHSHDRTCHPPLNPRMSFRRQEATG
jgi:hypothetical protein